MGGWVVKGNTDALMIERVGGEKDQWGVWILFSGSLLSVGEETQTPKEIHKASPVFSA